MENNKPVVLAVDDEDDIIMFVRAALERSGYTVLTAGTADLAIQTLLEKKVDLILTDINMPGASGFDLVSLARITENAIPIVLMSGHVEGQEMLSKGFEDGVYRCLIKPFSLSDLRHAVQEALNDGPVSLENKESQTA